MSSRNVNLPPGFRFCPTDEELVVHFLHRKAALLPCHPDVIPDLDLYPYDPWELDGKALAEGNQWYFYSRRTQNRFTSNGYWKQVGIDEPVITNTNTRVGMKRHLIFYVGEAPSGMKTNWIMEEYRLISDNTGSSSSSGTSSSTNSRGRSSKSTRAHPKNYVDRSKWVICRVYEKEDDERTELSYMDEVFLSLDDLDEISM